MSSDADYAAFLDKANQSTGGDEVTAQSKKFGTKSVNTEVPEALKSVEEYYVSDADEPFEGVALEFGGKGEVDAAALKKLLNHSDDVTSLSEKEFDPQGQYAKVLEAVKKAGNGKVGIFKVEGEGTRSEVYVVSVDEEGGKVVGLKALVVES
ncbi:hypothetical protein P154DRAFT_542924 [Amniculicola lignicola CBS 123094]|uniref:Uncharacterized protein n=1 Tax=Amniculicola lignicola CBS 123094 TaxID=1392246 RepID=A0A6A5WU02_9PLEO|nr:hypothetical protein P154DRAFT_542924 [Amniculicola lignicola CBS 123094]